MAKAKNKDRRMIRIVLPRDEYDELVRLANDAGLQGTREHPSPIVRLYLRQAIDRLDNAEDVVFAITAKSGEEEIEFNVHVDPEIHKRLKKLARLYYLELWYLVARLIIDEIHLALEKEEVLDLVAVGAFEEGDIVPDEDLGRGPRP